MASEAAVERSGPPKPLLFVGRGTLLNTATVLIGSLIGLWIGEFIPKGYQTLVLYGLGLVTLGLGIKLFLGSKSIMIVAASIAFGGILGTLLGIDNGLWQFGEWARRLFAGDHPSNFAQGVVVASILFCVGPMTLMGCLQEAVEGKFELIGIKSTLDGFSSIFLTALLGPGVLVSAVVIFVVQGLLTFFGSRLEPLLRDERLIDEASAAGGLMLLAIGLGLLEIKSMPVSNFLPSLLLAPLFVKLGDAIQKRRA